MNVVYLVKVKIGNDWIERIYDNFRSAEKFEKDMKNKGRETDYSVRRLRS